jgi:hypothetical protein
MNTGSYKNLVIGSGEGGGYAQNGFTLLKAA